MSFLKSKNAILNFYCSRISKGSNRCWWQTMDKARMKAILLDLITSHQIYDIEANKAREILKKLDS